MNAEFSIGALPSPRISRAPSKNVIFVGRCAWTREETISRNRKDTFSSRIDPPKRQSVVTAEKSNPCSSTYTLSMEKVKIERHSFMGIVWFGAWLFTIGFLRLTFWKGVLAIVLWLYYLGVMFSSTPR